MAGTISEGDLKAALTSGQDIAIVVAVVVQTPRTRSLAFVPYVQLRRPSEGSTAPPGPYLALVLYRNEGLKSFRDFKSLLRYLDRTLDYRGQVVTLREDDPQVPRLGLASKPD